jgi:hypothetical protein
VQQEPLEKGVGVEGQGLDPVAMLSVAVGKLNPALAHVDEARVREGDAVGIAAQIGHDVSGASKGGLGIDDPPLRVELIAEPPEPSGRAQLGKRLRQA